MQYQNHFKELLAKLIFLEINKSLLIDTFKIEALATHEEELFLPLSPDYIAENINKDLTKELPFGEFVKGMYYVSGADPSFDMVPLYQTILTSLDRRDLIKGLSAKLIKENNKEEALIYLLGLYTIHKEKDVLINMLSLLEELSLDKTMYRDALSLYATKATEVGVKEGHLFKGSYLRLTADFRGALFELREYLRLGGEETNEISMELEFLDRKARIIEGEEILYEDPQKFLSLILPLLEREEDNPRLLLMIGMAYRMLNHPEKAIYYLNEALAIDQTYVDVLNELGINYAALGDYEKAVEYFRALFEQVRTIEILTNLIMSYINLKDYEAAKEHIAIGELMDPEDEILLEIKELMKTITKTE